MQAPEGVVNSLAAHYPEIATCWHPTKNGNITPSIVKPQSNKKYWWQCSQGHEWEKIVYAQVKLGPDCPVCTNKKVSAGYNDLATLYPEIASLWHPTKNAPALPSDFLPTSKVRVWWQCEKGHEWDGRISNRISTSSCPVCSNRVVLKGYNDLASQHPALLAEWDYEMNNIQPDEIVSGASKKRHWKCAEGHTWQDSPSHRVLNNRGCPYCSGQRVLPGYNDLASNYPEIAAEWHPTLNEGLSPRDLAQGSNKRVWWQCTKNPDHAWQATPVDRRRFGCGVCTGKVIVAGDNDLLTRYPDIAATWHPTKNGSISPNMVAPFSANLAWWQCNKGHEWESPIARRIVNNCAMCSARKFTSKAEHEIAGMLNILGYEVQQNVRTKLSGRKLELDVYLDKEKFAIEFNGVYWHSEQAGKTRMYHAEKLQACNDAGITLYQVWEDDWRDKRDIIIRGILHRLGQTSRLLEILPEAPKHYSEKTYARELTIVETDYTTASNFLEKNHIQGGARGTYYLALIDGQERVRAMLVLRKTHREDELSIERYATAGIIPGGFTRLLAYAGKKYKPAQWVTFADRSISTGNLYEANGFEVDKILKPDYSYFCKASREHKFNYRKERFKKDPDLLYEEGLTERELAALNGLNRIWDSGKVRYVKRLSN